LVAASIRQIVQKITIGKFLEYDEPHLRISHRQTGCDWLHKFGMETIPANMMIASGAQNALAIALISLFSAGDKIAVDQLTYPGFKNLASLLGIRLIPIKADQQGMSPQALAKACKIEQIKGLYLMPECQNPTTITLSPKRRQQLAEVIKNDKLILIEDDTYAFLNQTGISPVSNLIPQQSIYISCTSKALSAGLRVAFMAVAAPFHEQIKRGIYNIDLNTSHFNVEIAANLIESNLADQIIQAKRKEAKKRNQLADKILAGYTLLGNEYDYFRWLKLPAKWNAKDFEYQVRSAGVQVYCSERFAVGSQTVVPAVRIAIASPKNLDELRLGLEKIRQVLKNKAPNSTPLII
jgi:DNA-binding transcriptional MocR family regulator